MIRSMFFRSVLGLGLLCGSCCLSGCSSDAIAPREAEAKGTFSMPLLASAGRHRYRLTGQMEIDTSYPYQYPYTYLDLSQDEDVAQTSLPTGDYSAYLYYWELARDDGTGNFQPVSASQVDYFQSFSIFNGTTTTVSFNFQVDGQTVNVGVGGLNVDIKIEEVAAGCSPLGEGCSAGAWCVPPELIGSAAGCIAAGPVGHGDPCRSPYDCVANASCFDFGDGAQCTELCSSDQFGEACVTGGTCTAQGVDYGVCAP